MATRFRHGFVPLFAVAVLLTGCSYGGSAAVAPMNSTPRTTQPSMTVDRAASTTSSALAVFLSSFNGPNFAGEVVAFPGGLGAHNPPVLRTIASGTQRPFGMWVDSAGTLYVVNIPDGEPTTGVSEYHPGATLPFRVLTQGLVFPTSVAVDAAGNVFVNQRQGDGGSGDFVTVFPPGKLQPSRTIDLHFAGYDLQAGGMAFDKHGNLLVAAANFRVGLHIFKVAPGSSTATELHLSITGTQDISSTPGVAVDGAGNLYVSSLGSIAVFAPGATTASRFTTKGANLIAVLPDGTLYASTGSGVDEYKPGANSPTNSITDQNVDGFGVAVGPAF
jgi:hypothetical protein